MYRGRGRAHVSRVGTARRTVGVVTVSRSDYGHLTPLLEALRDAPDLDPALIVAGMHLAPEFGRTVSLIEADGWPIAERVEMLLSSDSPQGLATSIGLGVAGFAQVFARRGLDLLVVLGDRFEMLAAAVAALPFGLPVAHVHGGEESEGAIDNQIRHAITKVSHLHFASAEVHAERIRRMGEERWRVHVVGAPGLDRIRRLRPLDRAALGTRLTLPPERPWVVVTFHPVTLELGEIEVQTGELLSALDALDVQYVVTSPNADTGGRDLAGRLEAWAAARPSVRLVKSLGDEVYLSLLAHAAAMVGNSSSGLIEAPSFRLPVVNVGGRQRGRLRARNVIDVGAARAEIVRGLERALDPGFRASLAGLVNPYGDGRAAARIAEVLRSVPLTPALIQKRFEDAEGGEVSP